MVVVTSDENLSTSNENTDDTVKESSHRGDVETIESKPNNDEVGVTSDNSIEQSSSFDINNVNIVDTSHHDEDPSFDEESSIQSGNFPTPPPPICHVPPNSFDTSSFEIPPDLINDVINEVDYEDEGPREYIVTFDENSDSGMQRKGSILSRGGSRASIKKKVNYNTSDEVIPATPDPPPPPEEEENDEVFSDSVAPMLPRGDMCTPFLTKRGSIPGLAALPDWFREEKYEIFYDLKLTYHIIRFCFYKYGLCTVKTYLFTAIKKLKSKLTVVTHVTIMHLYKSIFILTRLTQILYFF